MPVSLDCQFLIAPSVFSDVYYQTFHTHEKLQLKDKGNKKTAAELREESIKE
jgi:hypothetical protein